MKEKKTARFRSHVSVIEAISHDDNGRDAPILTELLKMAGWKFSKHEIKGKTQEQQKEAFMKKLTQGKERFIHISAHGEGGCLAVGSSCVTILKKDIVDYCNKHFDDKKPLTGRFVTLSACGEISGRFPVELHAASGATAIVSPLIEVGFAESAVFMVLFYFSLAKYPKLSSLSSPTEDDSQTRTSRRVAHYIDSFQRAKLAYLGIGGTGAFRLDYWWKDEHVCLH